MKKSPTVVESVLSNLRVASPLALYFVAPEYLELEALRYFRQKQRPEEPMQEKFVVVCQKGSSVAASYSLRFALVRHCLYA